MSDPAAEPFPGNSFQILNIMKSMNKSAPDSIVFLCRPGWICARRVVLFRSFLNMKIPTAGAVSYLTSTNAAHLEGSIGYFLLNSACAFSKDATGSMLLTTLL